MADLFLPFTSSSQLETQTLKHMETINYKMLVLARESRGLTQTQLSQLIPCLNQGNLSKMEKGILSISEDVLIRVSETLNYPMSFFYKSEPKTPINSFYYRKRLTFPKKELATLEAKMDIVRLNIDELLSSVEIPDFSLPTIEPEGKISPEDIARNIRTVMAIPKGPISNLVEYIEKYGVIVYFFDTNSDKFDGITLYTNSGYPIVFINKKMSNDRKRFTLGHELGHLIMHIPFTTTKDLDQIEIEANRFSSEFNMPTLDCRNDLLNLKYNSLGYLKTYWKLSKAAILFKAKAIGAINEKSYTYMVIELNRRGERKLENVTVALDEPKIIKELINIYRNELNYSTEELTQVLGISNKDYRDYFENNRSILRIA